MTPATLERTASLRSYTSDELAAALWQTGHLEYLLRPYQREVYREIKSELWAHGYLKPSPRQRRFVLEICRRWGKSFLVALLAFELCIQKPGARVYWAAETQKQVRKILRSVLKPLLEKCPRHMRPQWYTQDSFYLWPNGSEIHIAGCEDESKADRLRGDGCDLFVIDEAGSIGILEYVYRNLAVFMALDRDGRVFMPSTPARTPGHAFTAYCVQAELGDGGFARMDCYAAGFSEKQLEDLEHDLGGRESDTWQREALVQRVVDLERLICREFNEPGTEDAVCLPYCAAKLESGERCAVHYDKHDDSHVFVWELERPEHAACYEGFDFGQKDPTAGVFAYHHFDEDLIVFEDEFVLSKQPTTIEIAAAIVDAESELWSEHFAAQTHDESLQQPLMRVGDTALQVLRDLDELHGVYVSPARKDDKDASLNEFRVRMKQRKFRIHPRCRNLRAQLKAGIWDKKRKTYERVSGLGHCDAFDAARYLSRHVDTAFNPYPPTPSHLRGWVKPGGGPQRPSVAGHHKSLADEWAQLQDALFPDIK